LGKADDSEILIVEDELTLFEPLIYNLKHEGYAAKYIADGRNAVISAREMQLDLIVLDNLLLEVS